MTIQLKLKNIFDEMAGGEGKKISTDKTFKETRLDV